MAKSSVRGGMGRAGGHQAGRVSGGRAMTRKERSRAAAGHVRPVTVDEPVTHRLALWVLIGLLFLPAFVSGMFFPWTQDKGLIAAAVVFWLTWMWKYFGRDNAFLAGPLDYFALALPLAAIAAGIRAADYSLAVNEVVKYIMYFLVFWSVAQLITSERVINRILHAVYLSAVGVALAGLATATGVVNVPDGFQGGRIYSTFQYPNATASYLAAALILGVYLWHRAKPFRMPREVPALGRLDAFFPYQFLYVLGNFLLAAGLVGTQSYGCGLAFIVALILFFALLPRENRAAFGCHLAGVLIAGAPAVLFFLKEVMAKKPAMGMAWLMILAGAVLAALFQVGFVFLDRRAKVRSGGFTLSPVLKKVLLALGILVVVAVAAFAVEQTVHLIRHPELLTHKIYVKARARDVLERGYFYFDALVMFLHRPILGWGGGGWQAAYRSFQSYLYDSNQGHSYYLQVLVEMGAVGILIVIGVWYSFLSLIRRLWTAAKEDTARRLLILTVTMVAVEIGLHALIDFDLALSALFLVVWVMFGIARALQKMDNVQDAPRKERKKSYVPLNHTVVLTSTAFCAAVVLLGFTMASSFAYAKDAAQNMGSQSGGAQVMADLNAAAAYNPFDPSLTSGLPGGSVDTALAILDADGGKTANGVKEAQRAVAISPYNSEYAGVLSYLYAEDNQPDQSVKWAEKTLSLAPFQQQWYDQLASANVSAGMADIRGTTKNVTKARSYFENALKIPGRLTARMNSLNAVEKHLWDVGPPLKVDAGLNVALGQANYFLGNYGPAAAELKAAESDSTQKDTAMLWESLVDQKTGKTTQAAALLAQVKKADANLASEYDYFKGLSLTAAPSAAKKPAASTKK